VENKGIENQFFIKVEYVHSFLWVIVVSCRVPSG
jgi:hypothetical protein